MIRMGTAAKKSLNSFLKAAGGFAQKERKTTSEAAAAAAGDCDACQGQEQF